MNMTPIQYLTDKQWTKIETIITQKLGDWGGSNANDNRTFINACLYVVQTNCPWHNLPSEYGKYKGINRRFNRWRNEHIWEDILEVLLKEKHYEWLLLDPNTTEDRIPYFNFKWLRFISPSRSFSRQIQKQIEDKLDYSKTCVDI